LLKMSRNNNLKHAISYLGNYFETGRNDARRTTNEKLFSGNSDDPPPQGPYSKFVSCD
jgi:hypothetical protein